jgi:protein-tyrosine phosphatase
MSNPRAVLFVDRTNTVGSPLANAAFQLHARHLGLSIWSESVGTSRLCFGDPADPAVIALAAYQGLDLGDHLARQLRLQDVRRFSHIVALDSESLSIVRAMRPNSDNLSLLDDHAIIPSSDLISDLLAGEPGDLSNAFAAIDSCVRGLAAVLASEVRNPGVSFASGRIAALV